MRAAAARPQEGHPPPPPEKSCRLRQILTDLGGSPTDRFLLDRIRLESPLQMGADSD